MAIDWNLALGGAKAGDYLDAFNAGQGDAIKLQNAKLAQDAAQQQAAANVQYHSQVANLLRGGDYTGASALAYAAGDDKAGTGLSALQKQHFDQGSAGTTAYANVVQSVAALPYEQRRAAIQAAKPSLISMGAHPADIDAFDPTNDNIRALGHTGYTYKDQVADTIAQQNADTGTTNAETGRITAENPMIVGQGQSLVTRGGAELFRAPQYINAPVTDNVLQVPGVGSQGYTQGAISPDQTWSNMIGAESGGKQFAANGQPLTSNRGAIGIAQVMPSTGPEAAAAAGLQWDPQRYRTDPAYNAAIGRGYFNKLVQRYGGDAEKAAAAYNAGAGRVDQAIATGGDNWRTALPAETRGYISKAIGQQATSRTPIVVQHGSTADTNAIPGDPTKSGADYLASVPATQRSLVQAIADGRAAPPSPRTAQGQSLLAMVTQYDPSFDAANAQSRIKTRVDFTSGTSARTINSLNTAIGHAADLYGSVDGLNNSNYPTINSLLNPIREATGNTALGTFRGKATLYANEMEAAYRASGGSEAQIQAFQHDLSTSQSPDQIKSVLRGFGQMMTSKLGSMQNQYEQGMGTSAGGVSIISKGSAAKLRAMGIDPGTAAQKVGQMASARSSMSAPAAAQQMLRSNPSLRAAFDSKYGAGASRQVLGS